MKISKVKQMRTAVGYEICKEKKIEVKIGGIIYKNSASAKEQLPIAEHVEDLNNESKKLYNVIATRLKKATDLDKDIISKFNNIIKFTLLRKIFFNIKDMDKNDWNKTVSIWKCALKKSVGKIENSTRENVRKSVKKIVQKNLRGSLRRYVNIVIDDKQDMVYLPDIIEQLMCAFCIEKEECIKEIEKIGEDKLIAFLKVLYEDYTKKKRVESIVKSIQCKNVKVQPNSNGFLQLTSAEHVNEKKDYKSKKYIFEFIKQYANEEEKERQDMLHHMRNLIVLFLYGENYDKCVFSNTKIPIWKFDYKDNFESDYFSEEAVNLIRKRNENVEEFRKKNAENYPGWNDENREIKAVVRKEIYARYNWIFKDIKSNNDRCWDMELQPKDYFWLNWITGEVEKILYKKPYIKDYQLKISYLSRHIWDAWISFIAMKFIDMGKAVYHFTIPENIWDLNKVDGVKFGKELADFLKDSEGEKRNYLTSFDYERIKADETVERELSTYITFAVNTFAQAVVSNDIREKNNYEDVLYGSFQSDNVIQDNTFGASETVRRILQYFGGKSKWIAMNNHTINEYIKDNIDKKSVDFFKGIQGALKIVRNASVHYTAESKNHFLDEHVLSIITKGIIRALYDEEIAGLDRVYCEKYVSNNALMFYEEDNVKEIILSLYDREQFGDMSREKSKIIFEKRVTLIDLRPKKNVSSITSMDYLLFSGE